MWATFIGVLAVIAALMWAGPYSLSRHGTGVSAVSNPPVGTAGRERADEPDESPATLHDLETVTGTVDPHELIGQRVDFHVHVADINNDTSFWVGNKDNRMLVVHGVPFSTDVTPEAVTPLLERRLDGFGELFRSLSFEQVGAAALLSRAVAGTARGRAIFVLPGSPAAVELGLSKLVLPVAAHLVGQLRRAR